MGAATSSTIFFRSIGEHSRCRRLPGLSALTQYHTEFRARCPGCAASGAAVLRESATAGAGASAAEQIFGHLPNGLQMLQSLFIAVKAALMHGLQEIFFWSAVVMSVGRPASVPASRANARQADRRSAGCSSRGRRPLREPGDVRFEWPRVTRHAPMRCAPHVGHVPPKLSSAGRVIAAHTHAPSRRSTGTNP